MISITIMTVWVSFVCLMILDKDCFVVAKPYKALPKLNEEHFQLFDPMYQHLQQNKLEQEARLEEAQQAAKVKPDTSGSEKSLNSPDAIMNIVRATNFASNKHHYQRRKDPEGSPYIEHPVAVAHILTHLGKVSDPSVIISALLHDTVEDTDTTFDEIEKEFGTKIRNIVAELTDDKQMTAPQRKRLQVLYASKSSYEAKLVKLADKLHNLRDIEKCLPVNWTEQRKTQYFDWAREVAKGLKGTNAYIEAELEKMFSKYCTPIKEV